MEILVGLLVESISLAATFFAGMVLLIRISGFSYPF